MCFLSHMERHPNLAQCNLKPANMRGIKSFAMVLAVSIFFSWLLAHILTMDGYVGNT